MVNLTINVVTHNNQYGLSNDASILVKSLQEVSKTSKAFDFQVRPVSYFSVDCGTADINIFLEVPNPLLIHQAKVNILVPNNEWFFCHWEPYLELFDFVWCKSKVTEERFRNFTTKPTDTVYIGWTSIDRLKESVVKDFKQYLHLAGRSNLKGTQRLVDSWKPDWPILKVVYNAKHSKVEERAADNIVYLRERLDENDLRSLMTQSGVHICPSEAEGFGHYLNEARSCRSIVVTTNSEPMSQFANPNHLLEVQMTEAFPHTFSDRHIFDITSLEKIVGELQQNRPYRNGAIWNTTS